ncbi:MAG TPA: SRPBCC family protein [Acidobacteriota bacterium]|nr:SRPBCC family protein [Acidobacteriota bacterium]
MNNQRIAKVRISIVADAKRVWDALTNPSTIKQYMFGTEVVSEWKEGGAITWKGEWNGKPYEDKGVILKFVPERQLQYTHFSPTSGKPDLPENYHTVTVELANDGRQTIVRLSQDNNPTEEARIHSEKNWQMMLDGLKKLLEK